MIMTIALQALIPVCAIVIGVLLVTLRRQRRIGYASTIAYSAGLCLGAISVFALSLASVPQTTAIVSIITNLVLGTLPAFVLTYVLGYISQSQRLSYRILIVLFVIPLLLLAVFAMQAKPGVLTSGIETRNFAGMLPLDAWGWIMQVYSIGILVASTILTFSSSSNNLKPLKMGPLITLNIAIFAGIGLDCIGITRLQPASAGFDLLLAGYTIIGGALLYSNLKIPQTNLITREELFDSINDGIIILDNEDKILELNPAAEQLIGIQTHSAFGNSIESILTNWTSISGPNDTKEKEFRGSINLNNEWHHISVRINQIDHEKGKVIFLRDITDRKDTIEIRQRSREEMFSLLRSFFKSANTSQSSNDFFRDVLFQIAYTFRAESGAICIAESHPDSKKIKLSLKAKHGDFAEDSNLLSNLNSALAASQWVQGKKEPLIVSDRDQNTPFSRLSGQFGNLSIAVFPLLTNEQLMGVLMLARSEETGFVPDEIARLGFVTEELASFIFSDRQRKSDIALAERHRLAQDLHDSITQKLCGLVTLTEAVKLGLESGAPVDEKRMVERISENARQALREMRLFLYELVPVNIERDGLVSTLHQRLASVEGRADIQARIIADNDIVLSPEKETEVYYIVEEALNNILKHANAKSVQVKLKQRKESIFLEIVDNGCGFDSEKVKIGGRGLGNIRERAKRINGDLKISSTPEQGTKITLVVPQ